MLVSKRFEIKMAIILKLYGIFKHFRDLLLKNIFWKNFNKYNEEIKNICVL